MLRATAGGAESLRTDPVPLVMLDDEPNTTSDSECNNRRNNRHLNRIAYCKNVDETQVCLKCIAKLQNIIHSVTRPHRKTTFISVTADSFTIFD